MNQVIKRAKSVVDPRKYSTQIDWKKQSSSQLKGLQPREKKITFVEHLIAAKKRLPGPSNYKQWIAPRTHGFYGVKAERITVPVEWANNKKAIPAPSKYADSFLGLYKLLI
jgi:hypothetical protein